jgi:hypothetical protein
VGNYIVEIAGTEFRAHTFSGSVSSAGRTSITVDLMESPVGTQFWDSLIIYEDGDRIFEGVMISAEIYAPDNNNSDHYYTITCSDYSEITKHRVVTAEVIDMTAEEAIETYILPILAEEGITAGTISADWDIERDVWGTEIIYDVMEKLIKCAPGYIWYIDYDKKLHYYKKSTGTIEYLRDDSQFTNFRRLRDFSNYRNVQHARVSQIRTSVQYNRVPSPTPDGSVKTFTVNFPIAEKPTIYINSVAVDSDAIGVNGIDADEAGNGIEWFFSYNSDTITQASNETALSSTDTILVTYTGLRSGVISFHDFNEIAHRKISTPGFSGLAENVLDVSAFNTLNQVSFYVEQLIDKYGDTGDRLTFTTEDPRFTVGKRLQLLARGYNARFMIDNVSFSTDGYVTTYNITAYDEAFNGGVWEEFFYKMIVGQKTYNLNSSETLYQTISTPDTLETLGEYTITLSGTALTLPFTLPAILGGSDYTEVVIND